MEIHELVIEMKLLERRLTLYEEKYGVLSEDFYNALMSGKLADYDAYDETRTDFSRWRGLYETWLRRKKAYSEQIQQWYDYDGLGEKTKKCAFLFAVFPPVSRIG